MKNDFSRFPAAVGLAVLILFWTGGAFALSDAYKNNVYNPGLLRPVDSVLKVKVGQKAPDFTLTATTGEKVSLSQFRGRKNVVLSFVLSKNERTEPGAGTLVPPRV